MSFGAVTVLDLLVDEADGLLYEVSRAVLDLGRAGIPRTPPIEGRLEVFTELEPRFGGGGLLSSEDTYLRFGPVFSGGITRGSDAALLAV